MTTNLKKAAEFNLTIEISDERRKEIKEETGLNPQEYYDILVNDHLSNLVPEG